MRFNDHGDRFSLHTNHEHLTISDLTIKLKELRKEKRNAVQNASRAYRWRKVHNSTALHVLE